MKVDQIMRNGDQMAVVAPTMNVRDVLHEMTKRRAGAAVVTGADGELLGIFTHGDFARHFQRNPNLGSEPVEKFITRSPITIRGDRLAAEVLHILEGHRIDDLVVVDDSNKPIGIVDSQDLARFKLV
jgi:arabinose-5-phosphate isomerase